MSIFSFQLWVGYTNRFVPSNVSISNKALYTFFFSGLRATCPAHFMLRDVILR